MKPLPLHVNLLMMSGAPGPVFVILICVSSLHSGLKILHQKEGLITEAEYGRIRSTHYYVGYEVVVQIILRLAEGIGESLKICEICEKYQLLDEYDIKRIKGVSVCV